MLNVEIIRSTNPAPSSLCSLTEDYGNYHLYNYDYCRLVKPRPLKICSPKSAMAIYDKMSLLDELDEILSNRPKSAPPSSSQHSSSRQSSSLNDDDNNNDDELSISSSSDDPATEIEAAMLGAPSLLPCYTTVQPLPWSVRRLATAAYYSQCHSSTENQIVGMSCDISERTRQQDPDLPVLAESTTMIPLRVPPLRMPVPATAAAAAAAVESAPTTRHFSSNHANNNNNNKEIKKNKEQLQDTTAATATTRSSSNNKSSSETTTTTGGVLIIRPNPIKTAAPPNSSISGGVLLVAGTAAPTTSTSTNTATTITATATPVIGVSSSSTSPSIRPLAVSPKVLLAQPLPWGKPSEHSPLEEVINLKEKEQDQVEKAEDTTDIGEEKKTPEAQQQLQQLPVVALRNKQQSQQPQLKKKSPQQQLQQPLWNSSETAAAAVAKQRRENERLELKKKQQQRQAAGLHRLQEIQCTFPENFNNNTTTILMPPTLSGRGVSATEPDNSHQQQQQRSAGFSIGKNNNRNNNNNNNINSSDHNNNNNDEGATAVGLLLPHTPRTVQQPTPLFERLVTEEVQELKAYARIIENQNRRLAELERVHGDLEIRLEMESRGREDLEATLEAREREWTTKFQQLEKDRDEWKQVVQLEQTKNSRLIDQVVRKDQDIHRMLKKKYDNDGGGPRGSVQRNVRSSQVFASERDHLLKPSGSTSRMSDAQYQQHQQHRMGDDDLHQSPHDLLAMRGSAEKVRLRNVEGLLMDFFGI